MIFYFMLYRKTFARSAIHAVNFTFLLFFDFIFSYVKFLFLLAVDLNFVCLVMFYQHNGEFTRFVLFVIDRNKIKSKSDLLAIALGLIVSFHLSFPNLCCIRCSVFSHFFLRFS